MKDRIKQLRKALGLTQDEFANKLNVKRGAIANYEIGRNEPIDAVISLICREFHVSEKWLRTGVGEMFVPVPRDELDRLFDESALIPQYRAILRQLFTLPEADQRKAVDWLRATVAAMEEEEIDLIEAEIEAYRQELLAEKEAAEKPSASAESVG